MALKAALLDFIVSQGDNAVVLDDIYAALILKFKPDDEVKFRRNVRRRLNDLVHDRNVVRISTRTYKIVNG